MFVHVVVRACHWIDHCLLPTSCLCLGPWECLSKCLYLSVSVCLSPCVYNCVCKMIANVYISVQYLCIWNSGFSLCVCVECVVVGVNGWVCVCVSPLMCERECMGEVEISCMYVCMCVCIVFIYIYIWVCLCVYMSVCVCVSRVFYLHNFCLRGDTEETL